MKKSPCIALLVVFGCMSAFRLEATPRVDAPLRPIRATNRQGPYTIDTIGDTLGQSSPQNARLIVRVFGPDKKLVKPGQIALVDKSGGVIEPVFREDRKVGHEENTGLPLSMSGSSVGVDLGKVFGPHGDYSYTKVDWPKSAFTAGKRLELVLPSGQTILLPLTSLAK
jgi:hypothetical protein